MVTSGVPKEGKNLPSPDNFDILQQQYQGFRYTTHTKQITNHKAMGGCNGD